MDENSQSSILIGAVIVLFVISLSITLTTVNLEDRGIQMVRHWIGTADHRVQSTLEIKGEETYSGAQILQMLFQINQSNTDIQVENMFFSKNSDIENTDVSGIDTHKNYVASYIRDQDGTLTKIIFKGVK